MGFNQKLLTVFLLSILCSTVWGQVLISELCPANGDLAYDPDYFNFSGWVELHNYGNSPVDISGYYLSDDALTTAKWQIPAGTILGANAYLIIWCDKKDTGYHTNFSLDSDGEDLVLSNASQVIEDLIKFPQQFTNVSYGRLSNGSIGYMTVPTLNEANNDLTGTVVLDNPIVSLKSGRYASSQTVTLSHITAGVVIRYTLDGSEPTQSSEIYTNEISIPKTLTLKAKAFSNNFLPSKTEVKTYFINEHEFSLPVISISTNPNYLFSDYTGMYVVGTNGITGHCMVTPANWNQDWDRHAVFEYFDQTGAKKFDQGVELRIGGDCTRQKAQKSFVLAADDKYGRNHINEKLFDNKDATRYGGFIYRNGGNDNNVIHFRDALIQHIAASTMDIDYMDYKPTIFYLNGEYWGIQNMREKINGDYIESNYGISKNDIDLIEKYKTAIEGTADAYKNYIDGLQLIDLTDPSSFSYIDEHIDVQEFINYLVTEIYFFNPDWPSNNITFWRQRSTNGKFRWILWDIDQGLGLNYPSDHPTLDYVTNEGPTTGANSAEATLHIRLLLQNPVFKDLFIKSFATAMSSTFSPANFNKQMEIFKNRIKDEMPYHKARWGGTMDDWEFEIERAKTFMAERQPFMTQYLASFFGLNESIMMDVFSSPPNAGSFHFNNTITTPVVSGPYLKGESFTIKAVPAPGYTFSHWNISKENIKPISIARRGDVWRYFDQGSLPASDWTSTTYDDTTWPEGNAEFGYGDGDETTIVSYGPDNTNKYITTYFRKKFSIDGADLPDMENLSGAVNFDDGVIVYLNGTEVYRNNMPAGTAGFSTRASVSQPIENTFEVFTVDKNLLQAGDNVLSVEVHQSNPGSSDLSFDLELSTTVNGEVIESTSSNIEISEVAETYITMEAFFEPVQPILGIVINEIGATSPGITDDFGQQEDWIELYNTNSTSVNLAGLYITDDFTQKTKYRIPEGANNETEIGANSYKIIWADNETDQGPLHAGFRLSADGEYVGIFQAVSDGITALDEVTFPPQIAETSFARIANITGPFVTTPVITPGSENMLEVLTGFEEDPNRFISVYPNPTTEEITIRSSELIHQVSLYNAYGMELKKVEMHSLTGSLSLSSFPTGIYILLLETESVSKTMKVIKN